MKITKEMLESAGACTTGPLDRFGGVWDYGEWTPEVQAGMLMSDLRKYLGWLWETGIVPQWSMKKWGLKGANLRRADLRDSILMRADLRGANLRGARYRKDQLENALT